MIYNEASSRDRDYDKQERGEGREIAEDDRNEEVKERMTGCWGIRS